MPVPRTTGDLITAAYWNAIDGFQIASIDLSVTTTFSAIPLIYRDLQIRLIARTTNAVSTDQVRLQYAGATNAYFSHRWRLLNTTVVASTETAQSSAYVAQITGANAAANFFGSAIIEIPGYADANYRQLGRSESSAIDDATAATNWQRNIFQFGRNSTGAYTSVNLLPGGGAFAAGSVATLYGIGAL